MMAYRTAKVGYHTVPVVETGLRLQTSANHIGSTSANEPNVLTIPAHCTLHPALAEI
jgi:hypothetical protein